MSELWTFICIFVTISELEPGASSPAGIPHEHAATMFV